MGVTFSNLDALEKFFGEPDRNNRHDIWLWLYLESYERANFDPDGCDGQTMRDAIAQFLSGTSITKEHIKSAKDRYLVPNDDLKWITGENRQLRWLITQLEDATNNNASDMPPRLTGRTLLVAMIDIWGVRLNEKIETLSRLQNSWKHHTEQDHQFKWFEDKKDGAKRCQLAWEWLCKNKPQLTQGSPRIDNHSDLLAFFEHANLNEAEKTLFMLAIKKRWNGDQSREKMKADKKKQCNFTLSEKTIRRLDKLAETHDLSRTQIVEILIQMEADGGTHISDRLKVLRNL
jgi:hypothetical protein